MNTSDKALHVGNYLYTTVYIYSLHCVIHVVDRLVLVKLLLSASPWVPFVVCWVAISSHPPLIIRRTRFLQVHEVQPTERSFEQKRHLFQCPAIQKPKGKKNTLSERVAGETSKTQRFYTHTSVRGSAQSWKESITFMSAWQNPLFI